MDRFIRHCCDRLYRLERPSGFRGEAYLILPGPPPGKEDSFPLSEAVQNTTGHNGLLVFTGQAMDITCKDTADRFADGILDLFHARARTDRAFLWLLEKAPSCPFPCLFMGVNRDASAVTSSLRVPLVEDLDLMVPNGGAMTLDGTDIRLTSSFSCISFSGARAPKGYDVHSALLSLTGDLPGSFHYNAAFVKDSFLSCLEPGFSMSWPAQTPHGDDLETVRFPLFAPDGASSFLSFRISVSPARVCDKSTRLDLVSTEEASPRLPSRFRTIYGSPVYLQPSGFVFCSGPKKALPLCPDGDFELGGPWGSQGELDLMCGVSGTEYIRFSQGDALRFSRDHPGFVPVFPPAAASVVGEPVDLEKEPADGTFLTSWACLSQAKDPLYLTQPTGMSYYGAHSAHSPYPELLFQTETFCRPQKDIWFPLFPLSGPDQYPQALKLEETIVSHLRLARLTRSFEPAPPDPKGLLKDGFQDSQVTRSATPNGFLADLDCQGRFDAICLANNDCNGANLPLFFEKPSKALTAAFQSNPLFLVINNPVSLGVLTPDPSKTGAPAFHNSINIGDWLFSFHPGRGNKYNDYKTVMIIKGCKGRLYAPDQKGLVSDPACWTRRQDFSFPLSGDEPDKDQLANLSTWLDSYCQKAAAADPRYFSQFNQIAADENWQGILFLNVPLSRDDFPKELDGVLWGLPGESCISAHHIGIHMTALKQEGEGLHQDGQSSLFGLIYYQDPQFTDALETVPPAPGQYDFRLLSLKALFKNSTLKDFENYAQLTVGSWFNCRPDSMTGGQSDSMLLKGGYQIQNGRMCYTLRGLSDCLYRFDQGPLNKVEVTQIKMEAQKKSCRFSIGGFLDFREIPGYDLFSYGNLSGQDLTKQGLSFSNLILTMTKDLDGAPGSAAFSFDTDQLAVDQKNSVCRPKSLAGCLTLKPLGIEKSRQGQTPQDMGYLPVHTDKIGGAGQDWYGLRLSLPMGTLGNLASSLSVNACLLLAFGPYSSKEKPKCSLWIKLPGTGQKTGFFNLQNLMSLSIDQIRLGQDEDRFQLSLTDLSLKLFSLVTIPPKGSTNVTIFGGGQDTGEPGWFAKYQKQTHKKGGTIQ